MMKRLGLVGAALIAASVATPASAQQGPMQAGLSCGSAAGIYGATNVDESMFPSGGETVPVFYYQLRYSGLPSPTTVGILRYADPERGDAPAVTTFVAQSAGGTFEGAVRANISPEAQGGGANELNVTRAGAGPGSNSTVARDSDGVRENSNAERRTGGYTSGQRGGGIEPGEYTFDVFTGEMRQTTEGTLFIADPKGYLGTFTCGVSQIGE